MSIAGWLPTDWAKAIIPIAVMEQSNYVPVGTAFLVKATVDSTNVFCLVTARHVIFDEHGALRRGLILLSSRVGGGGNVFECDQLSDRGISWVTNNVDIAATIMPSDNTCDIRRFAPNLFESFANVREGDDIFFGFPTAPGCFNT